MNEGKSKSADKSSTPAKKPNELGGIEFAAHIKIFDPNTKEVLVKQRG